MSNASYRMWFHNYCNGLAQLGHQAVLNNEDEHAHWDMIFALTQDASVKELRAKHPSTPIGGIKPQFIRNFSPESLKYFDFVVAGNNFVRERPAFSTELTRTCPSPHRMLRRLTHTTKIYG